MHPFDESTPAEKLPLETIKWMNDAATFLRNEPNSAEKVFHELKLVLRLLAVRNPDSQSHATRKTFGMLIQALYNQEGSSKVLNDLCDLLIRIIDAKQNYKFNSMKHLAISGLGYLSVYLRKEMRQMAVNVFIIVLESFKICPKTPQTLWFRNTCLFTLTQCCTDSLDEKSINSGYQIAKSVLESKNSFNLDSKIRAFNLLQALVVLPNAKFLMKKHKLEQFHNDFNLNGTNELLALNASKFYAKYLLTFYDLDTEVVKICFNYKQTLKKQTTKSKLKLEGYGRLLLDLSLSFTDLTVFDKYIHLFVHLKPKLASKLIWGVALRLGTDLAMIDMLGVLLSSLSDISLSSTILTAIADGVDLLGNAVQPIASSIHQASLGLVLNQSQVSDSQLCLVFLVLKRLSNYVPQLLTQTINICLKHLELSTLKPEVAYLVGGMVSESRKHVMYGDNSLNVKVLMLALNNIKEMKSADLYKVGFVLLQGVLCLGPSEVKPFVPTLLNLWESHFKLNFCLEYSLMGLNVFLTYCFELITLDVQQRLSKMLNELWSSIEFLDVKPIVHLRLLQCFNLLNGGSIGSSLLLKYISLTTDPTMFDLEGHNVEFNVDLNAMTECRLSEVPNDLRLIMDKDVFVFFDRLQCDVNTELVNQAILLISIYFNKQPERIKESMLDTVLTNLENARFGKTLRQRAVLFNTAKLTSLMLNNLDTKIVLENRVFTIVLSIVKLLLRLPFEYLRPYTMHCCARLAKIMKTSQAGTELLASLVKENFEMVVADSANFKITGNFVLSIGYIANEWPHLPLLETMFKVFMPLSAHPNIDVHLPILESMRLVLETSEMVDLKFVKCTLKTIMLCMCLDSHNNNLNFRKEVASDLVVVLSRIGPVLSSQQQVENRSIILCLADQLQNSSSSEVRVLAFKTYIELYHYSRHKITWPLLILKWRDIILDLDSSENEVLSAVNGLLMLMKLSVNSIFAVCGSVLEDALVLLLDRFPRNKDLLRLFYVWLEQTCVQDDEVLKWISRLQHVVMKPRFYYLKRLSKAVNVKTSSLVGSEKLASVAPTAVAADEDVTLDVKSEEGNIDLLVWEARAFAIELLLHLLRTYINQKSNLEKSSSSITKKVGDIIKIAFSASTSNVLGLQYAGLALLNEVMLQFGELADPDFKQISLLEQYQVQIQSALTPSFGKDSSPSVAFVALHTTSTFLTSDIVKSKSKLTRLTKLLLESVKSMQTDKFTLGELEMTSNAQLILRLCVLCVFAEMKNSKIEEVVEPIKDDLEKLFVDEVFEFGRLKTTLLSQYTLTNIDDIVKQTLECQNHYLLQPVYEVTWVSIVRALSNSTLISPQILCGLCFQFIIETLVGDQPQKSRGLFNRNNISLISLETDKMHRAKILKTLSEILTPEVSTLLITSTVGYFEEIVKILSRVMLNSNLTEQKYVLLIARNLVKGQPETDDSVDHFFEVLKICMQPLRSLLPHIFNQQVNKQITSLTFQQQDLLQHTLDTLISLTTSFREVIQNDLYLCLLRIFDELNAREPQTASPSFNKLLRVLAEQAQRRGITFIIGALTTSMEKALENTNVAWSLLVASELTCINAKILLSPESLQMVCRFGEKCGDALMQSEDLELVGVSLQCIVAVFKACLKTPSLESFAYGVFPGLLRLAIKESDMQIQALRALVLYAVLEGSMEAMSIVVPVLVFKMNRDLLLQLATKQPLAFKNTVLDMDKEDKDAVQQMLSVVEEVEEEEEEIELREL